MIITFSKRDEYGNGTGVRIELRPMTPDEVRLLRERLVADGYTEGRTRKLSDAELSRRTQKQSRKLEAK